MEIGKPIRRHTVVPLREAVPPTREPATRPLPEPTREPARVPEKVDNCSWPFWYWRMHRREEYRTAADQERVDG